MSGRFEPGWEASADDDHLMRQAIPAWSCEAAPMTVRMCAGPPVHDRHQGAVGRDPARDAGTEPCTQRRPAIAAGQARQAREEGARLNAMDRQNPVCGPCPVRFGSWTSTCARFLQM